MKHAQSDHDAHLAHTRRRKRRAWLTVLGNILLHSCLLVVVAAAAWELHNQVQWKRQQVVAKRAEVDKLQQEIALLENRNQQLRYNVQYLKTDDGVEKVAREKLDLVKPGEVTFQVIPPPAPAVVPPAPPPAVAAPTPRLPWYKQVLEAF